MIDDKKKKNDMDQDQDWDTGEHSEGGKSTVDNNDAPGAADDDLGAVDIDNNDDLSTE